ncbi:MAG TPA: alpha/beta fold hydrolase [Blastocatellia bacterium]|nr:alpha/beta fold hydrolase [Blastocatellia bacterium]
MSDSRDSGLTPVEVAAEGATVSALFRPGPRPLVFVHGLSASRLFFIDAADRAEFAGRGMLLVDLPGFGHSAPPPGFGFSMREQAAVLAHVVDRLDLSDVTLVGHSMGGTIVILALDRIAHRVERLVLAEAVLIHDDSIWTAAIARALLDDWQDEFEEMQRRPRVWARGGMLRRRPGAIDRVAPAILHTSAQAMHASAVDLHRVCSDPELYQRFRSISRPFEYVIGDLHDNTPFCARVIGDGVAVRFVARSGHLMMLDNPDGFYEIVASACETAPGTTPRLAER